MGIQDNNAVKADAGKKRKLIRKKIVELLKGNTAVGDKVFPNATIPPWADELPVILVYTRAEPVAESSEAPRELERSLSLVIEIVAKGPETDEEGTAPPDGESLEDILDDISEEVEDIMDVDDSLADTADGSILQNTEMDFEGEGSEPHGAARLTYEITYYTMSPRVLTISDDLKTAQVDYHTGDVDDNTREAKDTLAIPV